MKQWNWIPTFFNWQFYVIMIFRSINLLKLKIRIYVTMITFTAENVFIPINFTGNILDRIPDINGKFKNHLPDSRFTSLFYSWFACVRAVRKSIHFFTSQFVFHPIKKKSKLTFDRRDEHENAMKRKKSKLNKSNRLHRFVRDKK